MYWRLIPLYWYRFRRGTGEVLRAIGEWFREIGKPLLAVGRVLLVIAKLLIGIIGAIVGGLGAAVLLALLVGIGMGADELGATVALGLFLPAWAGFFLLFFLWFLWHRELKRLLEGVLLTLAFEAFAFPLAGLGFAADHYERTVYLAGDQTIVWGNLVGVMLGGLWVVLGGMAVALTIGGLSFLLFLLLKFNLLHAGHPRSLAASRRMGRMVRPLLLLGVLAGLLSTGMAFGQTTPQGTPRQEPLPGITVAPIPCPIMKVFTRGSMFLDYTEKGTLGMVVRMERFKNGLLAGLGLSSPSIDGFKKAILAGLGLATSREDPALQAARQRLESYLRSTGNPNLQVGKLRDLGQELEGEIVTHSQELVERLRIDKRTGGLRVVR